MTTQSANPVNLPGPGRDSLLPLAASASGRIVWSVEIGQPSTVEWPPLVIAWGDSVAVATHSAIVLFDREGKGLWTQPKQVTTPIEIANGALYYKSKHLFLEAVTPAHRTLMTEGSFPGALASDVKVALFWPREKEFISVLEIPGALETAEGDSPDAKLAEPSVRALRNSYGATYGDELIELTGKLLLPPLLEDTKGVLSLYHGEVTRVDISTAQVISRFSLPLERLVDWSVDTEGIYSVLGYVDGRKVLVGLTGEGKELWRWTDPQGGDPWVMGQPPIHAAGKRVYVLTEGRVLAFEQERMVWEFNARDAALKHGAHVDEGTFELKDGRLLAKGKLRHGTALADGTVLVTGNRTLRHLDGAGKQTFAVTADEDLLSWPTVDAEGHIYVASATHLIRID